MQRLRTLQRCDAVTALRPAVGLNQRCGTVVNTVDARLVAVIGKRRKIKGALPGLFILPVVVDNIQGKRGMTIQVLRTVQPDKQFIPKPHQFNRTSVLSRHTAVVLADERLGKVNGIRHTIRHVVAIIATDDNRITSYLQIILTEHSLFFSAKISKKKPQRTDGVNLGNRKTPAEVVTLSFIAQ